MVVTKCPNGSDKMSQTIKDTKKIINKIIYKMPCYAERGKINYKIFWRMDCKNELKGDTCMQTRKRRPDVSKKVHREPQITTNTKNDLLKYEKSKKHLKRAKKFFDFIRGIALGVGATVLVTTDIDIILPISLTINAIIVTYLIDYTTLKNTAEPKFVEPR